MTNDNTEALCSLFLSLSDPTRLKIVRLLATEERSVGYLAEHLGESQPKVSRHLAFLRDHDVVTTRRDGKRIYYRICEPSGVPNIILSAIVEHRSPCVEPAKQFHTAEHIRVATYVKDSELPIFLL